MYAGLVRLSAHLMQISGTATVIGRRHAGIGAIFMLHSVVRSDVTFVDPFMQIKDTFLDEMLGYLVSKGIELISLDRVLQRVEEGGGAPFVSFTLDDGYRDNLTVALPVFQRWSCPLTIYVTTALVEHRMPYQWGCLRELVAANDSIEVEALGIRLSAGTLTEKNRCFNRIRKEMMGGKLGRAASEELFRRHRICAVRLQARDALTVADVRFLARDPLVEIGGHTDTHRRLAPLDVDEAQADILKNKAFLEALVQRPIRHFAFPYGDASACGQREADLARDIGFRTATTTHLGCLFPGHLGASVGWPRLHFRGSLQSRHFMECQRNGAIPAILAMLRRSDVLDGLVAR
jgi:peptidoglycan/xylan/chitin deacetylase (PgdA/CDA1 family)